jgi:alkylation response protein AidB-like acyl-CoA dehydrogenase
MCVAAAVQEMWHSANMAFGLCPLLTQGAVDAIHSHGSQALKDAYLPKMIEGVWTGTMNLTEPQAGSDLAAIRSVAKPVDEHYLISGQKIFITYGEHDLSENIVHLVLARTPDAPAGVKGISLFIVPKFLLNDDGSLGERNDVNCVSLEHKLGIHASPTAVLSFGDNGGAIGYLLGEENKGLIYMFTMMNMARHTVGVQGYSVASRAYQKAVHYSRDRIQGKTLIDTASNKGIINHPDVRRLLMTMRCQIDAMRMLALTCAVAFDLAKAHPDSDTRTIYRRRGELLTPMVKGWSTEEGINICSMAVQAHGGMGYIEETGVAQDLRDSRITSIYEGTTAIQANDLVGRKTLKDKGLGIDELIVEMRQTLNELKNSDDERLRDAMAVRFESAIVDVEEVAQWMLSQSDAQLQFAGSVDYLIMFGQLAGGWQQMKAAIAAKQKLAAGEGDASFYQAKCALAEFYALHILPRTSAAKLAILEGTKATVALDEAQF